ncbi:MAG: endonuclease/exonuclease/phosphatase family protein [Undibacterium sp.]
MKLLFLNLWHGKLIEPISDFLASQSSVDVFCFQEADAAIIDHIETVLPDYVFIRAEKPIDERNAYFLATAIRSEASVITSTPVAESVDQAGFGLLVYFEYQGKQFSVLNVHGIAHVTPGMDTKQDVPSRILQSETFLSAVSDRNNPIIIGGDFNLLPDTESVDLFRRAGYRDLIREYSILTTRNHLAWDRFPGEDFKYSDYVFLSPYLAVREFSVLDIEVSDHLPMIVEVE